MHLHHLRHADGACDCIHSASPERRVQANQFAVDRLQRHLQRRSPGQTLQGCRNGKGVLFSRGLQFPQAAPNTVSAASSFFGFARLSYVDQRFAGSIGLWPALCRKPPQPQVVPLFQLLAKPCSESTRAFRESRGAWDHRLLVCCLCLCKKRALRRGTLAPQVTLRWPSETNETYSARVVQPAKKPLN